MKRRASVLFVSVLLLGGCSEADRDADGPATTATTTTPTTGPATTATMANTAPGPPSSPAPTPGSDPSTPQVQSFCVLARSYIEAFTGRAAPGDVRGFGGNLERARSSILEMQKVAPPEVVDDVLYVADTLGVVVSALEEANYDLGEVPPEVLQRLQDPEFRASAARLQAYTDSACQPAGAP